MKPILIIMDNHHLRSGIVDILELEGYSVVTAIDGLDGLNKLKNLPEEPSLIFCDNQMPKLSGPKVLQELRYGEVLEFAHIPFVLLSAYRPREFRKILITTVGYIQPDFFISKPFDSELILIVVRAFAE